MNYFGRVLGFGVEVFNIFMSFFLIRVSFVVVEKVKVWYLGEKKGFVEEMCFVVMKLYMKD